jgi:hypothetical protein
MTFGPTGETLNRPLLPTDWYVIGLRWSPRVLVSVATSIRVLVVLDGLVAAANTATAARARVHRLVVLLHVKRAEAELALERRTPVYR